MNNVSALAPFVADDPIDFAELASACGRVVDAWLEAGGEPTDDVIVGFYGIWAQSLDVGKGGQDQSEDEADFYAFFYPRFVEERDALRELLGSQSAQ